MMKKEKFSFSEEDMRPYFPLAKVIDGLSQVVNKLYDITLRERHDIPVWNKDVKFYEVYKNDDTLIGGLYMDLFQREGKMSGGWANTMVARYERNDGVIQLPVGLIVMNFRPPAANETALLSLQDVLNIFHEFGHNTQKILTKVNARDVSGTEGVPWDGVELASQFMENFVWQPEVLNLISSHYQTGEKLPTAFLEKALEMRKFGKGLRMSGGLVLSIFEFRLHTEYQPDKTGMTEQLYIETYKNTALTTMCPWMSSYPNSFLHVFAGGYAAGYYSYFWAEELSADDFSPFVKNGKIDWSVGKKFEAEILSRGGSRSFMESNTAFLGRAPTLDSLMRQYGFTK
jgi:oligopeptidase A